MDKEYLFKVTGGFDVDSANKEVTAASGTISSFVLPDGRTVNLVVALEVEGPKGCEYIIDEQKMAELGFSFLSYDETEFEPTGDTVVELSASSIVTRVCKDCGETFNAVEGRPYKYEPSIWLCDQCHDLRMEESEEEGPE